MGSKIITDKTMADFETQTPSIDKEVPVYDAEGDIKHFWCGKVYGSVTVTWTRKPGKAPKGIEILGHDQEFYADNYVNSTADERAKRVPIIRKEKAEAKLLKLIQESGTAIERLLSWSKHGSACVLFDTVEEIRKDHRLWDLMQNGPQDKQLASIMEMLRKKGDSYFGGLRLVNHFINQIKPGGMADQLVAGVIEAVEKDLIPWPYVAGHLNEDVMLSNDKKALAIKLLMKHASPHWDDLGFYKPEQTVEGLVGRIKNKFNGVKPDVLDALTLE